MYIDFLSVSPSDHIVTTAKYPRRLLPRSIRESVPNSPELSKRGTTNPPSLSSLDDRDLLMDTLRAGHQPMRPRRRATFSMDTARPMRVQPTTPSQAITNLGWTMNLPTDTYHALACSILSTSAMVLAMSRATVTHCGAATLTQKPTIPLVITTTCNTTKISAVTTHSHMNRSVHDAMSVCSDNGSDTSLLTDRGPHPQP